MATAYKVLGQQAPAAERQPLFRIQRAGRREDSGRGPARVRKIPAAGP